MVRSRASYDVPGTQRHCEINPRRDKLDTEFKSRQTNNTLDWKQHLCEIEGLNREHQQLTLNLDKIEALEDKIKTEMTTLKEKMTTMEEEMITFSDLEKLRTEAEEKRQKLEEEREELSGRREGALQHLQDVQLEHETIKVVKLKIFGRNQ